MNIKFYKLFLSTFLLLTMITTPQATDDPAKALPQQINGWQILSDQTYDNQTLYNYIDGGAELFLSFGFSKVFNRIYTSENQPDIMVDIFYMNSSYDAFGVFTFSSGKIEQNFGKQSQESQGAIIFWKDNFYVSITSARETEESKKTITAIAKLIESKIKNDGSFPEIISYLPMESLDKESIRYFRHYVWLNSLFFLSNENILNINQNTQAVSALYNEGKNKSALLIVQYSNLEEAAAAKEKFINSYNNKLSKNRIVKADDGKWIGCESVNNFIICVFNGSAKSNVDSLLNSAKLIVLNK